MAKTKRKNLHYLTLRANRKQVITIPLKVSVAKQSVQLNRTIADIQRGQEGLAITCANAECGLRLNGTAFPHPAYIIEFTDRRAYVVDKLNKAGTPVHCVVYEHGQGSFQKAYDTKGKNTLAKMSGAEATYRLRRTPGVAEVPIIAMSASVTQADQHHSLLTGANAFVAKPVNVNLLLHHVGELLKLTWIRQPMK